MAKIILILLNYANINKTKKIFKWKPRTKIENGLTETIKYYENCFKKKL